MKKRKMKIFSGRTVLLAFVALILGISIYNWNAKNLIGEQMPMPFGIGVSVVLTGSMEPRLSANDLVIIQKSDTYEVNDIVVFKENSSLIIHKIIEINGDEIITKGDANNIPDKPIGLDDIKGKLIFDVPNVGVAVNFLKKPAVVISVLALIVMLAELSFRREKEKDSDEIKAISDEIKALMEEIENMKS